MKRESIADRGIWTAKKRYILNAWDIEGVRYQDPQLKIMGIEAIKSSTPAVVRTKLKEIFGVIINGTESDTQRYISDFRKEFNSLGPEAVSFPRGVSNVTDWVDKRTVYRKGCPIHVRGAIMYNNTIRGLALDKRYGVIQNGEKIKFIYLKKPNIIHENVISFISEFPKELKLDKYIDYELQFEKAFLDPLKSILDVIGWKTEYTSNLESFFT